MKPSDRVFGGLLFVFALALRMGVGLSWVGEAVWDGHYYDFGAQRIAEGLGYSDDLVVAGKLIWHPWCHYPVGYSAFLALFYRILGATPGVAVFANALTGAGLAVATWRLGARAFGGWRGRIAGGLVAVHPGLVAYAALTMTEPLASLGAFVAFVLATSGRRWGLVLGALVLGLSALVRPQALLCAPFLALAGETPLEAWHFKRLLCRAVLVTGLALVPVLPWTVRNCRVMDGCALVSTNGGWNLAIGSFPRATGRFETLRSSDGCREVTGQVQQDRCWFGYGVKQIWASPMHWLGLVPAKLGFTFDHESFAFEYLHQARPEVWPDETRATARGVTTLVHRVLVLFAALGCVGFSLGRGVGTLVQGALLVAVAAIAYFGMAGREPSVWPLVVVTALVPWLRLPGRPRWSTAVGLPLVLLGTTVLTHAVFFGEDRYHMVVTPVLCLLAAGAFRRQELFGEALARG
ncbi:MAG: glycosyltransferase family 39 protein [Myxococcales bacterium]